MRGCCTIRRDRLPLCRPARCPIRRRSRRLCARFEWARVSLRQAQESRTARTPLLGCAPRAPLCQGWRARRRYCNGGLVAAVDGLRAAPAFARGQDYSDQAGARVGRALSGGRRHRPGGAADRAAAGRALEADRRHRQQGRRQRHPGQRDRRQGAARRLHAAGHDQRPHHQSLHDQDAALRHRARLHADHRAGDRARSPWSARPRRASTAWTSSSRRRAPIPASTSSAAPRTRRA